MALYAQKIFVATDTLVLEVGLGNDLSPESGKNGIWEYYYDNNPDNQLKFKAFFKNNVLHGELIGYWPNGKVKAQLNFTDGLKDGPAAYFDMDGRTKYKMTYKDDFLEGEVLEFYRNGRIMKKLEFKSGEMHGLCQAFEDKAANRLIAEGDFVEGLRNGVYKSYASRKQKITEYFTNDLPAKNREVWYKEKLIGEFVLDTSEQRFTKILSYKDGKLVSEQAIDPNSFPAKDFFYGRYLYLPNNFR
jgi:hypothetical protein